MILQYYLNKIGYNEMPQFLLKYLNTPSLIRLKGIGYFCGMDYTSKDIYQFKEYITRYDHSISVALITYKLTKDKTQTLAGLFHDISTPCFSHVIDYMNEDYAKQESTEEYTETILRNDKYLLDCLEKDNISFDVIVNFKKYSVVDTIRPKLCADRLDGVILPGIAWTKNITPHEISKIVDDIALYKNEDRTYEIGFKSLDIAKKVLDISESIDIICHSNEDNYMMELLAIITKYAIDKNYIKYDDLYHFSEKDLFQLFKSTNDNTLNRLINEFETINKKDIPKTDLPNLKIRDLNPLVGGVRLKELI